MFINIYSPLISTLHIIYRLKKKRKFRKLYLPNLINLQNFGRLLNKYLRKILNLNAITKQILTF